MPWKMQAIFHFIKINRFCVISEKMACIFLANNAKTIYIDEVENGLHFSRMGLLLKNIIDFINNNKDGNLQVFMTTHNQEFIEILDQVIREKDFAYQTKLF